MASQSQSLLVPVVGDLPAIPIIRVKPTVARASPAANVGWTYRKRIVVANTGSEPISRFPYALNLGDSAALVSGSKAQADADDLRIIHNGREVARTLTDWNTAYGTSNGTLAWIMIPYLAAGASLFWDVWYGNTAAVSGGVPALTLMDDKPAFDIATAGSGRSSNSKWIYKPQRVAANAGLGGHSLSSGTAQPNVSFTTPGAFHPDRTRDSDDDMWQLGYNTFVDTNTYYQGIFNARRGIRGSLIVTRDSGVDGYAIRVPVGIASVRGNFKWINMEKGETGSDPVGRLVIGYRNLPDEPWAVLYENAAAHAPGAGEQSISVATYPSSGTLGAKEVCFAVWPYAGDNVAGDARPDRYIDARWDTTLEVNPIDTVVTQTPASEEAIYEIATELRHGGGGDATAVPPYRSIYLGNAKSASGAGTPRMGVQLNQTVKVLTAERRAEVWNSGLTAKVEDVNINAMLAVEGVYDPVAAATAERASVDWMPLQPVANPLTNPSFDSVATGWTRGTVTTNLTAAALVRDTGVFETTPAAGRTQITANTTGSAGAIVEDIASDFLPVGGRESVWVGLAVRVDTTNLYTVPTIWWYDATQALISSDKPAYTGQPSGAPYQRRLFAARVPETAVYYRVGRTIVTENGSVTGNAYVDTVEVNDTEIAMLDVASGTLVLDVDWRNQMASA